MARKSASAGRGLSDDGRVWDEDFAPDAFADFDFPRRRITGGKGRSADGNGVVGNGRNGGGSNGSGRTINGNGRSINGNGRASSADGWTTNGNGRSTNGNGRTTVANGHRPPAAARSAAASLRQPEPSSRPGQGVPGRRTVTIRGYGAERNLPWTTGQSRRRPAQPRHQRPGFRADRAAMWAVMLGIMLVVVAAASSHAAVLRAVSTRSTGRAPAQLATAAASRSVAVASPRRTRGY
jgi:hypothetical protein